MQNQDFIFLLENVVSSKQMAQHLQVTEGVIEELCEKELLKARYLNNGWAILKNQELPCLVQFKNVANLDKVNYNILNGHYKMEDIEGVDYWTFKLIEEDNNDNIGFQSIWIDRRVYKDSCGKLHTIYAIEIETYMEVTTWNEPLSTILHKVDYATTPQNVEVVGIFNSEADAYKYAKKLYPENLMEDDITFRYINRLWEKKLI